MTVVNDYTKPALADRTVTAYATPAIVPIRTTGTSEPVFCIHPIEGLTSCYAELVERFDENRPVYGVQATSDRPATMTALAAHYASEIQVVCGHGPVHLVGISFGGLLAHAIAVELQELGITVASLVLVASDPLSHSVDPQDALLAKMDDVIDRSRAEELLSIADHNQTLADHHFPGVYVGRALVVSAAQCGHHGSAWQPFVNGSLTKYLVPDVSASALVGTLVNRFL